VEPSIEKVPVEICLRGSNGSLINLMKVREADLRVVHVNIH